MKMSSFEYSLTKLDRQVRAANVRHKCLVAQRQRYLDTAVEAQRNQKTPFLEGENLSFDMDDLIFRNVELTLCR